MSDHPVKPASSASNRRLHRLQFRSINDELEEQVTVKAPTAPTGGGKHLGNFLPAQRQEQKELSSPNGSNRYKIPVPPHIEALPTQKVHTPASLLQSTRVTGPEWGTPPTGPLTQESPDIVLPPGWLSAADESGMVQTAPLPTLPARSTLTARPPLPALPLTRTNGNGKAHNGNSGVNDDIQDIATRQMPVSSAPRQVVVSVKPGQRPFIEDGETFGFDIADPELEKRSTIPMMVLKGITKEQSEQRKLQQEMKSEVSGAASNAGLVGLGNIIGSILKYVSNFLIQYGFGTSGYGLYTLSLSLVNLVSAIFNLGLDDAMVRYVAIYRGKQQMKPLRGVLIFCTAMAGIAGIIGALILLFFTPHLVALWISLKHHEVANKDTLYRATSLLQVMTPVIPLMTMQVMWFAGLRGFKAFKWRVLSTSILQPILLILLIGAAVVLFRNKNGLVAVALALFISTAFNAVLNMYFLFKQINKVATREPEQYEIREWLTFASLNFLTTVIDTVLDSIDTILLAAFGVPSVQLGQYGAAMRLSNFIAMPLLSLNNIFAPTIAELHSKGERLKLESMFKVVTKWSITFSLPIFLITVLFAQYLLELPGSGFASAWPLLIAFALGNMINAGTGAVGYMLLMTGYQRLSFLNSLVAVTVNIGLGIVLTPRYQAMGTAIATGMAIIALNLMRVLQVRVLLKMHPWRRDALQPFAAGFAAAAIVGGLLYLLELSHVRTSVTLGHAIVSVQLALIPVFLIIYIWLLSRFKSSPEDEIVLKALRKKFLRGKGKGKNKNKGKNVKEQKGVTYA